MAPAGARRASDPSAGAESSRTGTRIDPPVAGVAARRRLSHGPVWLPQLMHRATLVECFEDTVGATVSAARRSRHQAPRHALGAARAQFQLVRRERRTSLQSQHCECLLGACGPRARETPTVSSKHSTMLARCMSCGKHTGPCDGGDVPATPATGGSIRVPVRGRFRARRRIRRPSAAPAGAIRPACTPARAGPASAADSAPNANVNCVADAIPAAAAARERRPTHVRRSQLRP